MSIIKIAKIAGVSHTTVARVINNERNVRPETAARIREIMESEGYTPKAPGLRRGPRRFDRVGFKTGNIAFLTSYEFGSKVISASPIMNHVLHGLEESISSNGLSLIHGSIGFGRDLPPIISRGDVDGIIIWPDLANVSIKNLNVLRKFKIVYVMSGGEYTLPGDRVMPNNKDIGRIAADYLIEQGHKHIVFFTASQFCEKDTAMKRRWETFSQTAEKAGVKAERFVADQTVLQGVGLGDKEDLVLEEKIADVFCGAVKPTGMFVCYDSLTAKLYPILNKTGVKPGRDVEIVTCNNEESYLTGLDPVPLSINLQPEKIGRSAVEQLRRRVLNHDDDDSQVTIEIPPKLEKTRRS